jgi:alkylation response protein AidB-like acyl-CoA dehydrogenase
VTDTAERVSTNVTAEVTTWLQQNWDPDLTVGEWWERLGLSGWAAPTWPVEWYGKGLGRADASVVMKAISDFGALGAPGGLGLMLAGPTIIAHGSDEQKERYVRDIVTGKKAWCQLFSEPGAGSDLAGLQTRAVKDGDEWVVNGQKVWTSGGQIADLGMLIARTDPDVPKHQGISYFALDMHQGERVDVRPLREMTGRSMFNEVFIGDARVGDDALIGGRNNGWAVANTTLAVERASLSAGGGSGEAAAAANPGTVAGDLGKRVGDVVGALERRTGGNSVFGAMAGSSTLLTALAQRLGKSSDPTIRQDLARLYSYHEVSRFMGLRQKAMRAAGQDLPGGPNMGKLAMSRIVRTARDLGMRIAGAAGTLHAYDADARKALDEITGMPALAMVTELTLFSPGPSIYGGTDQVQRNIIGERVLGLPKEPSNDRSTAFKDLPKNG